MTAKVLLCDDEIHILRAAEIKMSRSGFEVQCANDGEEALQIIHNWRPDILVTDLQMPRMDGLELTRRLRADEATRDLPIVLLTAKGFEAGFREAATKLGILGVVLKPFSPRELIRFVQSVLDARAAGGAGLAPSSGYEVLSLPSAESSHP